MKVTGWTDWEDENYEELPDRMSREVFDVVVKEVRDKGYKFCGYTHQNDIHGTPIIDDKYRYNVSCRMWGDVMADAYNLRESEDDGYAYVLWAWTPMVIGMDGEHYIFEEEIIPKS